MSYASASDAENYANKAENYAAPGRKRNRVKTIVKAYIAEHFRPLKDGTKLLAKAAQIESVGTAKGWISGRSWPRDDDLFELCITCNDLQMQLHDLAIKTRKERESK